jgi:hypothetical protein
LYHFDFVCDSSGTKHVELHNILNIISIHHCLCVKRQKIFQKRSTERIISRNILENEHDIIHVYITLFVYLEYYIFFCLVFYYTYYIKTG